MIKQIQKIFLLGLSVFFVFFMVSAASASEVSGNLNTGVDTGVDVETQNCAAVSHGTVAFDYPTCTLTCNSGYNKSGNTCVAPSSGGGGGSSVTYCSTVTYSSWSTVCFGTLQTRTVASSLPSGCTLTSEQQASVSRTCTIATSTPPIELPITPSDTPSSSPATGPTLLENIAIEAGILNTRDTNQLLGLNGSYLNTSGEAASALKYKTIINLDSKLTLAEEDAINNFIYYGTPTTKRLGAGERAAVINSYFQAYGKLPNSVAEWSDVLKIASGRWPNERSAKAEAQAKLEFAKVYKRQAVMANNIDENAIMVISYGLLPLNRNLNSERVAIRTFVYVYGHSPVNALAWNIVRAIAYSGAKR